MKNIFKTDKGIILIYCLIAALAIGLSFLGFTGAGFVSASKLALIMWCILSVPSSFGSRMFVSFTPVSILSSSAELITYHVLPSALVTLPMTVTSVFLSISLSL